MPKDFKVDIGVNAGPAPDELWLTRRLRLLVCTPELNRDHLRVAIYALTVYTFEFSHFLTSDFADALGMKSNNVSRAFAVLEKSTPALFQSKKIGRAVHRKIAKIPTVLGRATLRVRAD